MVDGSTEGSEEDPVGNELITAIANLQTAITKQLDNASERNEKANDKLAEKLEHTTEKIAGKVGQLEIATGRAAEQLRAQGHEIRDLKDAHRSLREKVDSITTMIPEAILDHKKVCDREHDRLAHATGGIATAVHQREIMAQRPVVVGNNGGILRLLKPLWPYIVAAILSLLLGGGITVAVTSDEPAVKVNSVTKQIPATDEKQETNHQE